MHIFHWELEWKTAKMKPHWSCCTIWGYLAGKCVIHQQALGDTETLNGLITFLLLIISPTHAEMEHSQNLRESCNILLYSLWLPQCVISWGYLKYYYVKLGRKGCTEKQRNGKDSYRQKELIFAIKILEVCMEKFTKFEKFYYHKTSTYLVYQKPL